MYIWFIYTVQLLIQIFRTSMYMDGKDTELAQTEEFVAAQTSYYGVSADSPSAVLPPELLSIIFMFAKQDKRVPHKVPFEVTLSHVCRYWRAIAFITPTLWTRIDVYSRHSAESFHHYLERSSQKPLDVFIDIFRADKRTPNTANPLHAYESIVDGLLLHLHRIRHFSLLCYHQTTAVYWQSKFKQQYAPILMSLSVEYGTIMGIQTPIFGNLATIFEEGLPQLTYWETDTPNILPPPQQLRHLSTLYLHGLDPKLSLDHDAFIDTFSSMPALVNLSLRSSVGYASWPPSPHSRFALNNLKSLCLIEGGSLATRMLLAMSAPNLETLRLECSFDNFQTHLFGTAQMNVNNRPKFPRLKYLTLFMNDFTTSSEFAKVFPTITHLHYFYPNFREATALIQTLLPQRWSSLKTLVFSAFREKDAVHLNAALLRILGQRLHNNPLKTILIDKDHMRWLTQVVPLDGAKLSRLVKVDLLTANNYDEYWWNVFESGQRRLWRVDVGTMISLSVWYYWT